MLEGHEELLIRVDQNVSNLVTLFEKHDRDDKEFQKLMWQELEPLKKDYSERKGVRKFLNLSYGVIGGIITLIGTMFLPHR